MKFFRNPGEDASARAGMKPGRRDFLGYTASGAVLAATGLGASALLSSGTARAVSTNANIVIVGAGAAGISLASRLSRELDGARITIIDSREAHYYQPGLTLVATGAWQPSRVVDSNSRYIPSGVNWIRETVAEFDPDNNRVYTDSGRGVDYDYLLVANGLKVDFDAIEGMEPGLIGSNGIGCVYDNPDHAARTWQAIERFTESGGTGLFTRPPGALKCAGAPLKVTMLTEHGLRRAGNRNAADLQYFAPGNSLFSQPDTDEFLKSHFPEDRDIAINWGHRLVSIEPGRREATFATEDGERTLDYDFIHVVPPMTAPDSVRESALASEEAGFVGWLEVDRYTMQHRRYPNVFGAGDVVGTPIGKTAASVKAQVPVATENLISLIAGRDMRARYNGYTSCPLITERGRGILVEFDYDLKMVPSFGFISPYEEHWVPWLMKDRMLHAAYNAMLRGRI